MHISADAILFSSYHQRDLAVGLQSHQTIDHMTACPLQHFCPGNIILLIKTGLQFYQNRYLFSIFCCLSQSRDNRRIAADTIKGLLNSQHILIFCCLPHKIHHRIKGLVWMMHQDIPFTDCLENICTPIQFWHWLRSIFRCLISIKSIQSIHLHQESQIQRSANPVYAIFFDCKLFFQDLQQTLVDLFIYLQTDNFAPLTLLQLLLDLLQQIRCLIFVNGQIRISHDPIRMYTEYIITQEQLVHVSGDHIFQKDHCLSAIFSCRNGDDPRKY